ncbi:MAG: hypothetical protein IPP47_19740 [Bryobacterales bacterium]|nr:hypothetical protein [Bryobacterales bacterium]
MRVSAVVAIASCVFAAEVRSQTAREQAMIGITRGGAQAPQAAPADHFTGTARVDSPFRGARRRVFWVRVLFSPGARTA